MAIIMQGNMHRSRFAWDHPIYLAMERRADLLLLSEQYRGASGRCWNPDSTGNEAIWVRNPGIFPVAGTGNGDSYVWVKSGDTTYISGCLQHLLAAAISILKCKSGCQTSSKQVGSTRKLRAGIRTSSTE